MRTVFFLMSVLVIALLVTPVVATNYDVIDLDKACLFLKHQYVREAGLLRAAYRPWVIPDYYRIYINDNILAARALAVCGYNVLANEVLTTLANNYSAYLRTGRHEVLIGQPIPDIPLDKNNIVLGTIGNLTIVAEMRSNVILAGNYVDWLFLESINSLIKGDRAKAWELFKEGMRAWDGWGFRDDAFNESLGIYDTYKLALAVYAYRALGEPLEYRNEIGKILEVLSRTQDPESGGVFTGYKVVSEHIKVGDDVSDRNVETTSMVILALYSNYPEIVSNVRTSTPSTNYYYVMVFGALAAVVIATLKAVASLR